MATAGRGGGMLALFVIVFFVSLIHASRGAEFRVGEPGFQGQPRQSAQG